MLFLVGDTIILGNNGSIPWSNRDDWAIGDQEGLHLVTLGNGLTSECIIRLNIFLACQTHLVQLELLVGDATGL